MIDMRGFEKLIDAMGGVTLDIAKAVPIGGGSARIDGWIQPGTDVHLTGFEALWFARSREGSSDYERMTRQKCVVNALAKQATPLVLITRFNEIATAGRPCWPPTCPRARSAPGRAGGRRSSPPIASVSFAPPLIEPVKPDLRLIRDTVRQQIRDSVAADRAAEAEAAASTTPAPDPASTAAPAPAPAPTAEASGTPAVVTDTRGSGGESSARSARPTTSTPSAAPEPRGAQASSPVPRIV